MIGRRLALFAAATTFVLSGRPAWAQSSLRAPSFPRSELTIEARGGKVHRFTVELADTDERRAYGLMHRDTMPADHGMIFDFKRDQPVAMWMRNTITALDMLFIAQDGRIHRIAERTVPLSLATVESRGPVRATLELAAGTAERLNLRVGDRVLQRVFGTAP